MVLAGRHIVLYIPMDNMVHMHDGTNWDEHSYEAGLRAVGAFLDEQQACQVRVKAVAEGFEVSYHRQPPGNEFVHQLLRRDEIAARSRGPHPRGLRWSREDASQPLTYENIFRSIGRELQEASGHLLMLEEVDEGVVLTYQHQGRASGGPPRERHVILKRDDTWSLVAHGIRRRRRHQPLTSTARSEPAQ
jgi:hypothetical protein